MAARCRVVYYLRITRVQYSSKSCNCAVFFFFFVVATYCCLVQYATKNLTCKQQTMYRKFIRLLAVSVFLLMTGNYSYNLWSHSLVFFFFSTLFSVLSSGWHKLTTCTELNVTLNIYIYVTVLIISKNIKF